MTSEDRSFLKKYYTEDVKKLSTFLGKKLPWINFIHI